MTPKARQAALAKIHLGAQQVGIAEESYRALLMRVARVGSARDLDERGLTRVIAELARLGATFVRPARAGKKPRMAAGRQALLDKIDAYLAEAGRSIRYADGLARRMYKVERVAWCDAVQLRGVITALDKHAKKEGRATG